MRNFPFMRSNTVIRMFLIYISAFIVLIASCGAKNCITRAANCRTVIYFSQRCLARLSTKIYSVNERVINYTFNLVTRNERLSHSLY